MINIAFCIVLSFLYKITQYLFKKIKYKVLMDEHTYIWAGIVAIISLFYSHSYVRNNSFDFLNFAALKSGIIITAFSIIIARVSGYTWGDKKNNFNFVIIFPIFEEILFRGVILAILVNTNFLSSSLACIICGILFGIMHFQYFGLNPNAIRKVFIAALGGYFFSIMTINSGSVIPSIMLHMIFNLSAILFSRSANKK